MHNTISETIIQGDMSGILHTNMWEKYLGEKTLISKSNLLAQGTVRMAGKKDNELKALIGSFDMAHWAAEKVPTFANKMIKVRLKQTLISALTNAGVRFNS